MHSKNCVGARQKFGVGFSELSLFDHFNENINIGFNRKLLSILNL